MRVEWRIIRYAIPLLAEGLAATVKISVLAIAFGTVLGFVLGLMSVGPWRLFRWFVLAYVDFVRGTPLLVQVFLVYFALPAVGVNLSEFWAGVTALSLNAAGFIAEIVRAGISSIEQGQTEAAKSIGMTPPQILLFILLPQIYRPVLQPLTNELIALVKGSSLLSVISVYELTRSGQAIISEYFLPFEIYGLIALYYYVVISLLAWISRTLERRLHVW
jgi:polar amino acid transport system permease protein